MCATVFGLMAPLPSMEAAEYDGKIERAFRRACAVDGLTFKEAAFYMLVDATQLERQLKGKEQFQFRRTLRLAVQRPRWFGWFWRFLGEELDAAEVFAIHGLAGLGEALFASGRARMAHASVTNPRSEDRRECDSESLRVSA